MSNESWERSPIAPVLAVAMNGIPAHPAGSSAKCYISFASGRKGFDDKLLQVLTAGLGPKRRKTMSAHISALRGQPDSLCSLSSSARDPKRPMCPGLLLGSCCSLAQHLANNSTSLLQRLIRDNGVYSAAVSATDEASSILTGKVISNRAPP